MQNLTREPDVSPDQLDLAGVGSDTFWNRNLGGRVVGIDYKICCRSQIKPAGNDDRIGRFVANLVRRMHLENAVRQINGAKQDARRL